LVSGTLGDHGVTVLSAREGLGLDESLASDTAPLHDLVRELIASGAELRCLRDPTRGGLGAALTEIAARSRVGVELVETSLPLRAAVRGACELLGLDPLLIANEGKLVAFVAPESAERALAALRAHPLGRDAARIGTAESGPPGRVVVRTAIGGRRCLDLPLTDPLPRIC
jgi:hydrogenase expression/formation protein HypE